jgi:SNF2 family DNA or RNA helicase
MLPDQLITKKGDKYTVNPYQKLAYNWILEHPESCLFLGMSLGKTVIVLSYLQEIIYEQAEVFNALVIAPVSVARNTWTDELQKWKHLEGIRYSLVDGDEKKRINALNKKAEIYICPVTRVQWLCEYFNGKLPFNALVIDELSQFKSNSSNRFKSLSKCLGGMYYRIGLTGTPASNGLIDLWAQMYIIDLGTRLGEKYYEYESLYFNCFVRNGVVLHRTPRHGAEEKINTKLKDICLSMQTEDYIDLPLVKNKTINLPLPPEIKKKYRELRKDMLTELADTVVTAQSAADLTNKLLQFTSGAIYGPDPTELINVHNLKIQALKDYVAAAGNCIIVYQYTHEKKRILKEIECTVYNSSSGGDTIAAWNRGEIKHLLLHPASAGYGLNLQFGGSTIIWVTPTYNLEYYLQTNARIIRRGQEAECTIVHIILQDTVDAIVWEVVGDKNQLQNNLLKHLQLC